MRIAQTLAAAAGWSDVIYVYDNGSTDGTWETVLDLSRRLSPIILTTSPRAGAHHQLMRSSPPDVVTRVRGRIVDTAETTRSDEDPDGKAR